MLHRSAITLLAATLASGCVSAVSIDAEDEVSFPSIEVSIPVGGDATSRVRLRASRADGDFDQSLDGSELIRISDANIFGPAEVDAELDLEYYSVAFGRDGRFASPEGVRSSIYIGISQTRFDLSMSSGQRRLSTQDDTTELYLQYGIYAEIAKSLDFGLTWAASLGREFSGINEIDLLLEYQLGEHLRLVGGYRWLTYEYGLGDDDSTLEVDFRGPVFGLHLPF